MAAATISAKPLPLILAEQIVPTGVLGGGCRRGRWQSAQGGEVEVVVKALPQAVAAAAVVKRLADWQPLGEVGLARVYGLQTTSAGGEAGLSMVREYVPEPSLGECLRQTPCGLPWLAVRRLFDSLLASLAAAERRRLVHGRLHPGNLFPTADGGRLVDFELASPGPVDKTSPAVPAWWWDCLAPERGRADAGQGSTRAELFSLGVCLHLALCGQPPWPNLTSAAAFFQHWRAAAPEPVMSNMVFHLVDGLAPLLRGWLHPDPHHRPTLTTARQAFATCQPRPLVSPTGQRYDWQRPIARGGGGELFQASRASDGRPVALKIAAGAAGQRLRHELDMLRLANGPGVVAALELFDLPSTPDAATTPSVLVLEWLAGLPGWTLRERLRQAPAGLPRGEALALGRRCLELLVQLHKGAMPVVHGDLKPANLYAPPGRPQDAKLLDFGCASQPGPVAGPPAGTPDYLPPETAAGEPTRDPRQTDIFGLGCCLYEALTGKRAFPRLPADPALARQLRAAQRNDAAGSCFDLPVFREPPALATVVGRAVALDPRHRFASSQAFLEAWRNLD